MKLLKQTRKNRRIAKNRQEITGPVVIWSSENRAVIKSLEKLLGEVRKEERRTENRMYMPRTKVLENDN